MNYLNARPRQAKWAELEVLDNDNARLTNKQTLQALDLNASSQLIWSLCDGSRTTKQLSNLFVDTYQDQKNIEQDITDTIQVLSDLNVLVFDGGDDALEYKGGVIRTLSADDALIENLENIRSFLFTELKVMEADTVDSDMQQLLGLEALLNSMVLDADSAGSIKDSRVISYKRAMVLPVIKDSIQTILTELDSQLPEVESKLEVSGNAIYLRGSHMGWHSNHSRSDGRVYCTWAENERSNFFRYQHPLTGEIITEWEEPGWTIKSFTIPPRPYRFWHCIGADSLRLSLGFRYNLPGTVVTLGEKT